MIAIIGTLIMLFFGLLAYDYIFPRWYYDYKAKKTNCGPIAKSLSWPFGFASAYHHFKLMKQVNLLSVYRPPYSTQTTLAQINTYFILLTADPENMKALLSTQFTDFDLSNRPEVLRPLLGNGIFTVEGNIWRQQRTMLRPIFARERVSKLGMLNRHFQSLLGKINSIDGFMDVQKLFFAFTLDTSLHFLFDLDFDSFSSETPMIPTTMGPVPASQLFGALGRISSFLGIRRLLARIQSIVYTRQFRDDITLAHSFADAIVDRVLSEGKSNDSFIAQAAAVNPDKEFLRDQAFTMFAAGRSTTASLLTHLILDLSQAPEKWTALREAVLSEIGDTAGDITFENLKQCKYLAACLNESLRLHPNVPLNIREAVRDTTLPRGGGRDGSEPVFVPKGVKVQYNVYGLHRDPSIWGDDAHLFRPERWSEHKVAPWTFIPFNGGPRVCLGQQFALNEGGYVLARLAQEFAHVEPGEIVKAKQYKFSCHLTIRVDPGVDVKFS